MLSLSLTVSSPGSGTTRVSVLGSAPCKPTAIADLEVAATLGPARMGAGICVGPKPSSSSDDPSTSATGGGSLEAPFLSFFLALPCTASTGAGRLVVVVGRELISPCFFVCSCTTGHERRLSASVLGTYSQAAVRQRAHRRDADTRGRARRGRGGCGTRSSLARSRHHADSAVAGDTRHGGGRIILQLLLTSRRCVRQHT